MATSGSDVPDDVGANPSDGMSKLPTDYLNAMIATLQENQLLLTLPDATRDFVFGRLGSKTTEVVELEMVACWESGEYDPKCERYRADGGRYSRPRMDVIQRDVNLLAALPGGASRAFDFLLRVFGDIEDHFCSRLDVTKQWSDFDRSVTDVFRVLLKYDGAEICSDFSGMRHAIQDRYSRYRNYFDGDGLPGPEEHVEESLEFLHEWHSRRVGKILSLKVAGHRLPPELVEMIEDCFYDKELLRSLEMHKKEEK